MLILLYGPDTYRSLQKLNEIIKRYKKIHKSGLNLKYYECDEDDFEKMRDELQQTAMFKEKKLIILKNVFQNREFKEKFLKHSKKIIRKDNIILFFESYHPAAASTRPSLRSGRDPGEILERDSLFKFLTKNGKVQKFEFLSGKNLRNWIKKEIAECKAVANPEAIEKLINFAGSDAWRLSNEIKKLANYRKKDDIRAEDVELLVRPKIETDIFKTIDAIALKNKKQALLFLRKHLERGDSPSYLLSMINFQFRNLILIKNMLEKNYSYQSILKKSRLHPYVIKKSFWQVQKFSFPELKKIYQKIFQADLGIKTGRIKPETALDLLISEI